jgi:hypothetical protein
LFNKLAQKEILIINLLKDVTYSGKKSFYDDLMQNRKIGEPFPSTYTVLVDYCKELLAKEEANIQNAIQDTYVSEEGCCEVSINITGQEILLNLFSVKNDKVFVIIYDVLGGIEFEAGYNLSKGHQTLTINVSNFKKGIYIIHITTGAELISKTINI